jgi:hypothetical protein
LFRFVSFAPFSFILFHFCFILFHLVSFRFVSFHFVSFCFILFHVCFVLFDRRWRNSSSGSWRRGSSGRMRFQWRKCRRCISTPPCSRSLQANRFFASTRRQVSWHQRYSSHQLKTQTLVISSSHQLYTSTIGSQWPEAIALKRGCLPISGTLRGLVA